MNSTVRQHQDYARKLNDMAARGNDVKAVTSFLPSTVDPVKAARSKVVDQLRHPRLVGNSIRRDDEGLYFAVRPLKRRNGSYACSRRTWCGPTSPCVRFASSFDVCSKRTQTDRQATAECPWRCGAL